MPGFSCPWRCLKLLEPFVDWTNVYGALCIIHLERFQTKYEFVYSHSAVLHLQTQFNFSFFFLRNIESSLKAFGLWNIRIITYAFLDYRLVLNSFDFILQMQVSGAEKRRGWVHLIVDCVRICFVRSIIPFVFHHNL